MKKVLFCLSLLFSRTAFAEAPALSCNVGPATKTIAGSSWLVYACNDDRSVAIMAAPGSTAIPFYFMFFHSTGGYRLVGEGNGNKAATDAAYSELSTFKSEDISGLFNDAKKAK